MNVDDYLEATLENLSGFYQEMSNRIEAPIFVDIGGVHQWRYNKVSDSLACFLKGVKVISTINASMVLLKTGHTQEIGALCRMTDDYWNEIMFLLSPQDGDKFSQHQIQFLNDFFQEEFDNPTDPFGSTQKRANVPVKKIHATFGKISGSELNPSDAQELLRTTHQAFSGYVHGAYPCIMEMFGGANLHLNGMLGTPRVEEWRGQLIGYVYRSIMITVFVAIKLGFSDLENDARELVVKFETELGCKSDTTASELLKNIKSKSKPI